MTEFPRDNETEQYIDFLLDRVEWLEQELEKSEREKLELMQSSGAPVAVSDSVFDYSGADSVEEEFQVFADKLVEELQQVRDEDLGMHVMLFKLELLQLEKKLKQKQGGLPRHLQAKSQETHRVLDQLLQACIRKGDIPP